MKVLHTIESSSSGGAERLTVALATGLAKYGYEPVLAAPEDSWVMKQAQLLNVDCLVLPKRCRTDIRFLNWLTSAIKEYDISLLHAHMMAMNLYGSVSARLARIPAIATFHGRLYDFERRRRRLIYRLIAHLASCTVAVSEELGRALIQEAGISSKRVMIFPNGVDISRFPTPRNSGIKRGVKTIISVGSLTEVKGHRYLIEAFARISKESDELQLQIVGEGPCRQSLENLRDDLGLRERVHLLGNREDIPALLSSADLFVLPSLSEGQSLSLLEAMAAGLSIVATQVGGNAEIIKQKETGLLVPPKSSGQIAAAICLLINDVALAGKIGNAARQRVEVDFNFENTLANYDELYNSLLSNKSTMRKRSSAENSM